MRWSSSHCFMFGHVMSEKYRHRTESFFDGWSTWVHGWDEVFWECSFCGKRGSFTVNLPPETARERWLSGEDVDLAAALLEGGEK